MNTKDCRANLWFVAVFLIFATILQNEPAWPSELRVVILDVGMGQSILLQESGHGILMDTGPADQVSHVLNQLKAYKISTLDYLILTHLHPDHAAGYLQIGQLWPNIVIFDNCHSPDTINSNDRDFLIKTRDLLVKDLRSDCLTAGNTIYWQGHRIQVLWPTVPSGSNLNTMSLVLLLVTRDGRTVLVMGDAGIQVEQKLTPTLRSILQKKRLDLYVAGHHAAADSTDKDFLGLLRPVVSVVSVGSSNQYGYPADRAIATLQQFSDKVLRTDLDGELCFRLKATEIVFCKPSTR